MLSKMRNDSIQSDPDAYSTIFASAYRIASGWTSEESGTDNNGIEYNSAYLVVSNPAKSGRKKTDVDCHVCGIIGYNARCCSLRKSSKTIQRVHVARRSQDSDDVEDGSANAVSFRRTNHCLLTLK